MFLLNILNSYFSLKTLTKTKSQRFLSLCWRKALEMFCLSKFNSNEHIRISWQMYISDDDKWVFNVFLRSQPSTTVGKESNFLRELRKHLDFSHPPLCHPHRSPKANRTTPAVTEKPGASWLAICLWPTGWVTPQFWSSSGRTEALICSSLASTHLSIFLKLVETINESGDC